MSIASKKFLNAQILRVTSSPCFVGKGTEAEIPFEPSGRTTCSKHFHFSSENKR